MINSRSLDKLNKNIIYHNVIDMLYFDFFKFLQNFNNYGIKN